MSILLLLDMFYEEWKEILLLWDQGNILDGYEKLLSKPHPVGKFAFNYLVGLKESLMVKLVHNLKATKFCCKIGLRREVTRTS
jgi:hypothetical protein